MSDRRSYPHSQWEARTRRRLRRRTVVTVKRTALVSMGCTCMVAGIASVFAMALGTAITVSALAVLAVTAKNWAVGLAGDGRMGNRVHAGIEFAGAAFVFLLGITLLSASLAV